ncbi:DUF47 family protein [Candidatus Undinarchaeota archaeon]
MTKYRMFPHKEYEIKMLRLAEDELDSLEELNDSFIHAVKHFISGTKKASKLLDEDVCEAVKLEDNIDDLVMKLESCYYDNIFFPLSPQDRITIAKNGDEISSAIHNLLSLLEYDGVVPIKEMNNDLLLFAEKIHIIVTKASQMTRKFYKYEAEEYDLEADYSEVSTREKEIDELLCGLLQKIPKYKKKDVYNAVLYRDLVLYGEKIADACMKTAEDILIIHTKIT